MRMMSGLNFLSHCPADTSKNFPEQLHWPAVVFVDDVLRQPLGIPNIDRRAHTDVQPFISLIQSHAATPVIPCRMLSSWAPFFSMRF